MAARQQRGQTSSEGADEGRQESRQGTPPPSNFVETRFLPLYFFDRSIEFFLKKFDNNGRKQKKNRDLFKRDEPTVGFQKGVHVFGKRRGERGWDGVILARKLICVENPPSSPIPHLFSSFFCFLL